MCGVCFVAIGVADGDANDSLSDSEENYQVQQDLSVNLSNSTSASIDRYHLPNVTMIADCVQGRRVNSGPITASLFPHVPPYITFASHEEKGPLMPPEVIKILKWKLTTITPLVIRKILVNSGFRLLKSMCFAC